MRTPTGTHCVAVHPHTLPPRGQPRRRAHQQRGLALLMTILVLTSLLTLGISLSLAVKSDFEEAVFFRAYNEAHLHAQEGMAEAMGFLMYDTWGVNESRPFVCSQWKLNITGDRADHMTLGDTFIADAGGIQYAFQYDGGPLLASELELRRVQYNNVPFNRFGAMESTSLVADWDWVNLNIGGGTRVNQHEGYGGPNAGRSRYTDAFLPTNSDINDWFENGLHFNRSDLQGYFRMNYPNRETDLYAGGEQNGWGRKRDLSPVNNYHWHPGYGDYHGLDGFNYPFAEGKALDNDPVVNAPWNFVNTNQMVGDSFTRVFRSDLVDANYENNTYDAMLLGPKVKSPDNTLYGGAINLNEVNNNYEFEQYPGAITPNNTAYFPVGSPDYISTNVLDDSWSQSGAQRFYYSGRTYHYNEAKWIYSYNEMGKPTGRVAVTFLADGGLPNINGLGNPRYFDYQAWEPYGIDFDGLFPCYDRGTTLFGNRLWGRKSYGTASNTAPGGPFGASMTGDWREWSDEVGANFIKNGGIKSILKPGQTDIYAASATLFNHYWNLSRTMGYYFRRLSTTSGWNSDASYYTSFPNYTANIDHPKFLAYMSPTEVYAGPNKDAGDLRYFNFGVGTHSFFHLIWQGPIRTRAEFMMLLKKRVFMIDDENDNGMAVNGLDENRRGNGVWYDTEDWEIAERDAQMIAGLVTPIGYSYTLDADWDRDRLIVDSTGDLYMGQFPTDKNNCYFWSGLGSQSRTAGDDQSGYDGPCPTVIDDDDQMTPGPAPKLNTGDMNHGYRNMHRKVKGKTGAKALLVELARLQYLGDGMGVKAGGFTPYSPIAARSDSTGLVLPMYIDPTDNIRRANATGALTLANLVSICRIPNVDYVDQWRSEMRFGDTTGCVVNWKPGATGGWDPDITLWTNMHWRQAWEVASAAEWDLYHSWATKTAPQYGAFQLHQFMRSSVNEIGRARVYPPYYQNDLDGDGKITGNSDFRKPLVYNNDQRLFLPKYTDNPYNQWMTHRPAYCYDGAPIGLRQTWANMSFDICDAPTTDPYVIDPSTGTNLKLYGFFPVKMANNTDYKVRVSTKIPLPVKLNDEVVIAGAPAPFNGNWTVAAVNAPNSFEIWLTAAQIGASTGPAGGGTVNLRMTGDPAPALNAQTAPAYTDYAYPEGLPLVMNYIELCYPIARDYQSTNTEGNEPGESMANKSWRVSWAMMPSEFSRMWLTDYDTPNTSGWTNISDGEVMSCYDLQYNTPPVAKQVRWHAGYGNSQPFFYVKGRLMQPNPNGGGWYTDLSGKLGIPIIVDMFDQFDPVHWGVSVREADNTGNLVWVNYNTTELQQRAVQRVFGRIVDMTWGIGYDRIPANAANFDEGYRWTTRAGNRGLFIRAHTPQFMERGIKLSANGQNKAFPFENFLLDMPVTLAMRQLCEKSGTSQGGPDGTTGGTQNLGAYLCSFTWFTSNRTYGQDCDWTAFHWWAMDGRAGYTPPFGPSAVSYSASAPIIRWDPLWDRAIDGHHDAYVHTGSDTSNSQTFSPTAGNASFQSMTQGHPEQFKVIYFHPYFFPQKIVYGNRSRVSQLNSNNTRYYDYVYPKYTMDAAVSADSPNWISTINRAGGLVTLVYAADINLKMTNVAGSYFGTSIAGGAGKMIRVAGCPDASFNGVFPIVSVAGSTVTFRQDGLPDATVTELNPGVQLTSRPAGFCYQHWAFARCFGGAHQLNHSSSPLGVPAWAPTYGAPVLPDCNWMRTLAMNSTVYTNGSFFPIDCNHSGSYLGSNANAQSPAELVERVEGVVTLPDYLGVGDLPAGPDGAPPVAAKLWQQGPWWVDGDEGQGPVEMDPTGGLVAGDFIVDNATGAHGRVVTATGGKSGAKLIVEPCAPYTGGFNNGDGLSKIALNEGASPFETHPAAGAVSNARGQRLWTDYGRYCSATINTIAPLDTGNVDPSYAPGDPYNSKAPTVFSVPPASSLNTYLRSVLEFSISTPYVIDNVGSRMWQYNSAYGFKAASPGSLATDPNIYGAGAATRFDPAFGNVRWFLAEGTDHSTQVMSLPTPMERNSNHVAWGASPGQRDLHANGIEADPNRPGFNRHNGMSPGSPVSEYVSNKLELGLYQIGSSTQNVYKNMYFTTPLGHLSANELDFNELNWWDLCSSTRLDDMWELGVFNRGIGVNGGPGFNYFGKDPLTGPYASPVSWSWIYPARKHDMAQTYTNFNSYNDFIDNMDQGIREILTREPMRGVDAKDGRVEGHYNIDRKTVFKINPNLVPSPAIYGYLSGTYIGESQPTYVFGNKPARGYISSAQMIKYCGTAYSSYHLTHWSSRIWYKQQMLGPSSYNDYFGVIYVENGYARLSHMVTFNPAPVYTALITAQALNGEGQPDAQIRLSVGIERTFDGKCNILEYQINPGFSGVK